MTQYPGPFWKWSPYDQTRQAMLVSMTSFMNLYPKHASQLPIRRYRGYPVCTMPQDMMVPSLEYHPSMCAFINKLNHDDVLLEVLPTIDDAHEQLVTVIKNFGRLIRSNEFELPAEVQLGPSKFHHPLRYMSQEWMKENHKLGFDEHNEWVKEWYTGASPFYGAPLWMPDVSAGY